jgi:sugar lactone lactonase YvrE
MRRNTYYSLIFSIALASLLILTPTVKSAPGDLYVPQAAEGTILKFSLDGTKSTLVSGLDNPTAIAFDQKGNLFASEGDGSIVKITPSGEMTVFATGISIPGGLAFTDRAIYM